MYVPYIKENQADSHVYVVIVNFMLTKSEYITKEDIKLDVTTNIFPSKKFMAICNRTGSNCLLVTLRNATGTINFVIKGNKWKSNCWN